MRDRTASLIGQLAQVDKYYLTAFLTFVLAGVCALVAREFFFRARVTKGTTTSDLPSSPSKEQRNAVPKTRKREVAKCPFSDNVTFIQESADHLPPTPLDLYEDWTDHIATRWLAAGLSGQDTPGVLRAGLKRLRHSKHFLVQEPFNIKTELMLKKKNMDDPVARAVKFVMEEESLDAQRETLELFMAYLPDRYPDMYTYSKEDHTITVHPIESTFTIAEWMDRPLELCERIVQEDLVLMRPGKPLDDAKHGSEGYYMSAAAVCFSFTKLPEKLSQPVEFLHAPVPGYEKHLRKTMNMMFSKLQPEQPLWRNNWGFSSSGSLDEPFFGSDALSEGRKIDRDVTKEDVKALFLEIEYQTIRRLPRSGYLLFTIRTMVDPLHSLEHVPAKAAQCLAASIRGMSPEMRVYKGIADDNVCEAVLMYLDSIKDIA